jgi:Raf kinase inhibitor-like YbhB/YbcL family protein
MEVVMALSLSSDAFTPSSEIPKKYTCEGEDISPPLAWKGAPDGTQSFALIVDDPDAPDPRAPERTYVHWVVVDLPADAASIAEAASGGGLPGNAREGMNDWDRNDWGGPCPPIGRHRYFFKLYALDTRLDDLEAPTKAELEEAMQEHVLEEAQLIGTYQKQST